MRALIAAQQAQIEALQREVTELRARAGKNSSNSSKPPSSDPPWKKPEQRRRPGERKRGGQPGHDGHERQRLVPDEVIHVRPAECGHCGEGLRGDDRSPTVHQVTEVPEVMARVREYRLHSLCCSRCQRRTAAPLPADAPRGAFGLRLQSIVALLTGRFHLSKRNVEEMLEDIFDVQIGLGTVCNIEHAVSAALAAPAREAHAALKSCRVVHADETSWAVRHRLAWLWVGVTSKVEVFRVGTRRDAKAAQELLGKQFPGILVSDRFVSYDWLHEARRQTCWAHLIRDFRALVDRGGDAKLLGEELLEASHEVFDLWHRLIDGHRRAELPDALATVRERIAQLLRRGAASTDRAARTLCKGLLEVERTMWLFASERGVEPTNNAAERALRSAVLWRKRSFGTQGERGNRFVERILTVVGTLRKQGRNVLEYLTAACRNAMRGHAAPRLLEG
jgi:transposase